MKTCCIYKITSPSGRIYIGQTVDWDRRRRRYFWLDCKKQTKLYRSFVKYGIEKHSFEIIIKCKASELNRLEENYIIQFNSFNSKQGLNLQSGGGSCKPSLETRKRMSKSAKLKKPISQQTRDRLSLANKGRVLSESQKQKLILANTGRILSDKQKNTISQKTKEAMANLSIEKKTRMSPKGRVCSDETKRKRSLSMLGKNKGKIHSAESRKNMSNGQKGKVTWNKGVKADPSQIKRMVEARRIIRQERLSMIF